MKGRLYQSKPLPPKSEFLEFFISKKKPWEKNSENVYTWRSSIPEKWISLKGQQFFKHISQQNYPRLSIDFFQNSKKYDNSLKKATQDTTRAKLLLPIKKNNTENHVTQRRNSLANNYLVFDKDFANSDSNSNIFVSQKKTVIENHNRSKSQITKKSVKNYQAQYTKNHVKSNQIEIEYPIITKGLLGWKLKHLREFKFRKNENSEIIHKKEESPLAEIVSKRVRSLS